MMADHDAPKPEACPSKGAEPDPVPAIGNLGSEAGIVGACDPRCERFAACRPDSAGWVPKREVAAHLNTTLSALKQRALRLGYVSPARTAMPRRDQPKLCFDAAYFILCAQLKKRK
jgi:hypothetical protein